MKTKIGLLFVLAWLGVTAVALAQETEFTLRLSRDFGLGLGTRIEGTFSYRVSAPDNVVRVVFLMDGEPLAEDTEPPFRHQFRTAGFTPGLHTLSAVGYTAGGQMLTSNSITREFLSAEASQRVTVVIFVPIILVLLASFLIPALLMRRSGGDPLFTGPAGSAICAKCNKPFAMHFWAPNIVVGKYDRCPHCGKWSVARRAHPDVVRAAVAALEAHQKAEQAGALPLTDADVLRKQLDDSRFSE